MPFSVFFRFLRKIIIYIYILSKLNLTGTSIHNDAINLCRNFKLLFAKYGKCHKLMNSCEEFNAEKINELG